ncbi:MAG: histidine kinase [Holophaga sp.]|nr:histidine kinase [Holophaga sp.]
MNASQILASTGKRLRRPGTWGAVLLFGSLWNALRWLTGPHNLSTEEFLLPFAFGMLLLGFAAAPWQWTGDDRSVAPGLRGVLQALPWNALFLLLLIALLPDQGDHGSRGGRGGVTLPFLPNVPPRMLVLLIAYGAFGMLAGWILADRDQEALRAETQSLRAEAQTRLAREAQARALQTQMNPHVLYNTLSGLAELAREDGAATEEALVALAALLRQLQNHSGQFRVSLDEERGLVEGFLALERFRLGDRLSVQWLWDTRLEDAEVPPLLLQPLVENALKHGIIPCREGGELEIGLSGEDQRLRLWVANTGKPLDTQGSSGTGLANLRQRLALMDDFSSHLDLRSEGGRTVVELILEPRHD